jgi:hypothetical protein
VELYSDKEQYKLYQGNMLDMLEVIEPNTIDSIVTDPPYELGFMGKSWDNTGIAFKQETWEKCFEVLKTGGYLLAFGGSRTFHRIATAIEDAGFEIRDTIMWLYGSGFPKSMALDKALEGKLTIGSANKTEFHKLNGEYENKHHYGFTTSNKEQGFRPKDYTTEGESDKYLKKLDATTELAKIYKGWGTALKPSYEPIIVARKPFKGSLVDNVIEYGVGGINIDECRIPFGKESDNRVGTDIKRGESKKYKYTEIDKQIFDEWNQDCDYVWSEETKQFQDEAELRKWLDDYFMKNIDIPFDFKDYETIIIDSDRKIVIPLLDTFKPQLNSNSMFGVSDEGAQMYKDNGRFPANVIHDGSEEAIKDMNINENDASRYFYCAKASKKDRDEGLDIETEEYVLKENINEDIKNNIKRLLNL